MKLNNENTKKFNSIIGDLCEDINNNESLESLYKMSADFYWDSIEKNMILEDFVLLVSMETFHKFKEFDKSLFIAKILNKYYPGFIVNAINNCIKEERYESCSIYNNYIDVKF